MELPVVKATVINPVVARAIDVPSKKKIPPRKFPRKPKKPNQIIQKKKNIPKVAKHLKKALNPTIWERLCTILTMRKVALSKPSRKLKRK